MLSNSVAQWIRALINYEPVSHDFESRWGFYMFYLFKNFQTCFLGANIVNFENS